MTHPAIFDETDFVTFGVFLQTGAFDLVVSCGFLMVSSDDVAFVCLQSPEAFNLVVPFGFFVVFSNDLLVMIRLLLPFFLCRILRSLNLRHLALASL